MNKLLFAALALSLLSACATVQKDLGEVGAALNSNITVVDAAQALTDAVFLKAAPEIASAMTSLPPATQTLVQAAFATLQKGIDHAEQFAWSSLPAADQAIASGALETLKDAAHVFHTIVHEPNTVVPPTVPLQDQNGLAVAITVPVADPNVTVTIDPNKAIMVDANTVLPTDPNATTIISPNAILSVPPLTLTP